MPKQDWNVLAHDPNGVVVGIPLSSIEAGDVPEWFDKDDARAVKRRYELKDQHQERAAQAQPRRGEVAMPGLGVPPTGPAFEDVNQPQLTKSELYDKHKDELIELAESRGIEVRESDTKKEIVEQLTGSSE